MASKTMNGNNIKIFGDYQTPLYFAREVCSLIKKQHNIAPEFIIEPNCGLGNFLVAAQEFFTTSALFGFDISKEYVKATQNKLPHFAQNIICNDLLKNNVRNFMDIKPSSEVLIIGNPPWATNSQISKISGNNLPKKTNLKNLSGLDCKMGSSNFDICEYMILRLIQDFSDANTTFGILCKQSVARNVFEEVAKNKIKCSDFRMYNFDARKVFNVGVDACLLLFKISTNAHCLNQCNIYDFDNPSNIISTLNYTNKKMYSCLDKNSINLDGRCCFEWRQGIKHDCASVMELKKSDKIYINKQNQRLELEDTFIYPLVKSSDIKSMQLDKIDRYVIVTQKKPRENTAKIQTIAPKTWDYLNSHIYEFQKRKSVIYKDSPNFAMFGVGEYSFKKYKVAISGFYKTPLFSLISTDKAVMLDDTCYFLSFDSFNEAYMMMLLLNSKPVQNFLTSIAFLNSKRPYTKKILQRIDIKKAFENTAFDELRKIETTLKNPPYFTKEMYDELRNLVFDLDKKSAEIELQYYNTKGE